MVMPFGAVADLHFVPTIDLAINTSWKGNGEQTFFFYLKVPWYYLVGEMLAFIGE